MNCQNCGREIRAGAQFCGNCGAKVQSAEKIFCGNCGVENKIGAEFCGNCGRQMSKREDIIYINRKKTNKTAIALGAILVVVLIVCIGTAAYVLYGRSDSGETTRNELLEKEISEIGNENEASADLEALEGSEEADEKAEDAAGERKEETGYDDYECIFIKNTSGNLNIRSLPQHESELVGQVSDTSTYMYYYGECKKGVGSDNVIYDWYKIRINEDIEGWVRSDLVINIEEDEYLFPSDREYITVEYLSTLTRGEIGLIRNEIYARHGYIFNTEEYRNYLNTKSWYVPNPNFDASMLTDIEIINKDTIVAYEKQMGLR